MIAGDLMSRQRRALMVLATENETVSAPRRAPWTQQLEKVEPPGQIAGGALSIELQALDEALERHAGRVDCAGDQQGLRAELEALRGVGCCARPRLPAGDTADRRPLPHRPRQGPCAGDADPARSVRSPGPTRRPATRSRRHGVCLSTRRSPAFAASRASPQTPRPR